MVMLGIVGSRKTEKMLVKYYVFRVDREGWNHLGCVYGHDEKDAKRKAYFSFSCNINSRLVVRE